MAELVQEAKEEKMVDDQVVIPVAPQSIVDKLTKEMQALYQFKSKHDINKDGSVTFWPTPDCKPSKTVLKRKAIAACVLSKLRDADCSKLEACSNPDSSITPGESKICSFIEAALLAWSEHYPFRFKPEHIWLLVLQGVAVHVDQNAEKLRDKYVAHEGKKRLEIERDDFVVGSDQNDWAGCVEEFAEQIDKNTVGDTAKLLECDFSASSLTEKIAGKVTLMDICKNYFEYGMMTYCGFPQLTLSGNKQDWINLKGKCAKVLSDKVDPTFGKEWALAILPLLDRFIVAFDGQIDPVFWNSMIKRGSTGGSGSYSYFTGWFNILFPFLKQSKNRYCVPYSMERAYVEQGFTLHGMGGWGREAGGDINKYSSGIASAPVEWDYHGNIIKLKFLSGFVGYTQDDASMEITPNVAWFIAHELSDEEKKQKAEDAKKRRRW